MTGIWRLQDRRVQGGIVVRPARRRSGATLMRRIQSTLAVTKETYRSERSRSHQQVGDMRHGTRRVAGTISSHIAPGAHKDWFAALFRKAFVATTAVASLSLTIAASGSSWTITRGTGSFISDGLKIGDVVRITAGSSQCSQSEQNLLITAMTATVLTVAVLNPALSWPRGRSRAAQSHCRARRR